MAYVQSNSAGASPSTALSVTLSTNVAVGDLVVVMARGSPDVAVNDATNGANRDNLNNSYTLVDTGPVPHDTGFDMWMAVVTTAGSLTVRCTQSSSRLGVSVHHYNGMNATPLDVSTGTVQPFGVTQTDTDSFTTTGAGVVIGMIGLSSTPTPETDYGSNLQDTGGTGRLYTCHRITTGALTGEVVTWTHSAANTQARAAAFLEAGSSGITADLSKTLGNLTLASAAKLGIDADLTGTLGALTLSSAAKIGIDADLAGTMGALGLQAAAGLPIAANLSGTLGDLTLTSTFTITNNAINAAVAQTLGDLTLQAAGQLAIAGQLAGTLGNVTVEASGVLQIQANLTQTLGDLTLSAAGSTQGALSAQLAQTLGDLSLSAAATLPIAGSLEATLGYLTLQATGTLQIQATVAQTLGDLTLSATTQPGPRELNLSATLGDLTLSAYVDTGAPVVTPETPAGTGGGVLPVRYRKKPVRSPSEPTEPLQVSIVATEDPDRASLVLEMVEAVGTVRAREIGDHVRMDVWQAMAMGTGRATEPEEWVRCHMETDWSHDDRDIERIDRLLFGDAA